MKFIKQLAGETAIYGISSILSRLLNFVILLPFFTRVFSETDDYGIVSLLFSYAGMLMVIYTYRMETAFFRFASKEYDIDRAFSTGGLSIIITTVVFTVVLLLGLDPLVRALQFEHHPEYVVLVIFIIAADALSAIPFSRLRLENRPYRFAFLKIINIIAYVFFVIAFLEYLPGWLDTNIFEDKIEWVFIANLIASTLVLLFLLPMYRKMTWQINFALLKKMLWYAAPLIVVGAAAVINQLVALPLLENLLPGTLEENRAEVGLYSVAAKMAVLMNLFTQAFNYAAEPFFFKNAQHKNARQIYGQVAQAFAIVGATAFLGIMLYLDIIQLFIGKNYRGGLDIIPILLLAYLMLGLYYNFSIWYKLADKTYIGALISIGGVVITLSLNFLLVPNPEFGSEGAAWAALACYGFMGITGYLTGQKFYPIEYPIFRILYYIVLAVSVYLLSEWLVEAYDYSFNTKLLCNTLLMIAFGGLLFLTERKSFMQMS